MQQTQANPRHMGYVKAPLLRVGGQSNEWYTPPQYIQAVRDALGGAIDLDPFSDNEANEVVKANKIFTPAQDALTKTWSATTVFMNPPYSGAMVRFATQKFIEEFLKGSFKEGIVLVNNATDTIWFKNLVAHCTALCFTDHRIKFYATDNKAVSGNTRGQTFLYFKRKTPKGAAPAIEKFKRAFAPIGLVVVPA